MVRSFDELVAKAVVVDVTGWGFDWLNGRVSEQRPPWRYARLIADRLGQVGSALASTLAAVRSSRRPQCCLPG